jgi:large subunit ribosomal protein L29
MYIDEVRALGDVELANQLEDLKESLFNLRFQRAFNQLEDQNAIGRTRRDIARVKMVMRERELARQTEGK